MARLVKSLVQLRGEINRIAPNRDKTSDGWIGDAAHRQRRSDHNPEEDGTVDALDIDHDPANGCDVDKIFEHLIRRQDIRISYMIRKGRICSGHRGPSPWIWRDRGKDPRKDHWEHGHISVLDDYQDDDAPWLTGTPTSGDDDLTNDEHKALVDIHRMVTDVHGAVGRLEQLVKAEHEGDKATAAAIVQEIAERLAS